MGSVSVQALSMDDPPNVRVHSCAIGCAAVLHSRFASCVDETDSQSADAIVFYFALMRTYRTSTAPFAHSDTVVLESTNVSFDGYDAIQMSGNRRIIHIWAVPG